MTEEQSINEIMSDYNFSNSPDIVKVVWMDAHTNLQTCSYTDIKESNLIQAITIGYLMDEKEDSIAVCSFLFPDQNHDLLEPNNQTAFRNVNIIPKSQIKAILVLKVDWEESKKYREKYKKEEKDGKNKINSSL